ncbi:MAG: DUF805 domain-containing protein [Alcanivoracaceae bacterium]|nr:DUF805 domain-containing protein [Alcanivoracaceae bacterium]
MDDSSLDEAYRAPRAGYQGHGHIIYEEPKAFSFSQRISRLQFACYSTASIFILVLTILLALVIAMATLEKDPAASLIAILAGVGALFWFVYYISLAVRRLHDIGRTGWMVVLLFANLALIPIGIMMPYSPSIVFVVSLISPLFSLYLFGAESDGMNRYGTPPMPNSTLVKIFGGFFWVFMMLGALGQIGAIGWQYVAPEQAEKYLGNSQQIDPNQLKELMKKIGQ